MPVIINEIEIITESPAPPAATGGAVNSATGAAPVSSQAPSPEDVAAIMRHQAERASRIYAG